MPELFAPDPAYDGKPTRELVDLVWDSTRPISFRLAAVTTLGRRCADEPELVGTLGRIASDTGMRDARIMHLVSLAYIAVAGLVHCGTPDARAVATSAMAGFDKPDQTALASFLRSGGFSVPSA